MKNLIVCFVLFLLSCQPPNTTEADNCYKEVDAIEFNNMLKSEPDAVLIDVRTAEEFQEGHIEGALNWDFSNGDFDKKIKDFDSSKKLYVYCRSGNRSTKAANQAIDKGLCDVVELKGGIVSWQKAGIEN